MSEEDRLQLTTKSDGTPPEGYSSIPDRDEEETKFCTTSSEKPKKKKTATANVYCICIPTILVFSLLLLIGGAAVHIVFNIMTPEEDLKNLRLPLSTTYNMSVDSNKYSGIEFTLNETMVTSGHSKVNFYLRAYNESIQELTYSWNNIKCEIVKGKFSDNCTIIRYWPHTQTPSDSYLTCKKVENEAFISWKWVSLIAQNDELKKLKCPKHINNVNHECSTHNHKIEVKDILSDQNNGTDTVVIQFCPTDDVDVDVEYNTNFKEERPHFLEPYNIYIMEESSITVPLTEQDHYIYIETTKGTGILELKLHYINKVGYRNEYPVNYTILGVICFVCILLMMALVIFFRHTRKAHSSRHKEDLRQH